MIFTDEKISFIDIWLGKIKNHHTLNQMPIDLFIQNGGNDIIDILKEYNLIENCSELLYSSPQPRHAYFIRITPTGHKVLNMKGGFREYLGSLSEKEKRELQSFENSNKSIQDSAKANNLSRIALIVAIGSFIAAIISIAIELCRKK